MENDLKFTGQNPVMINFNGDTEDIYAPVKTTSCDVDIVSDQILDDLYSANLDEICVKIEKGTHGTEWVVVFDDPGSVESLRLSPDPTSDQYFTISYKNLFYEDINGDFRFNGSIKDANNVETQVNLKYVTTNNYWVNDNLWEMENGDWYFHNGTDSYKIHWNGTNHTIQKKTASGWDTAIPYVKENIDLEANAECGICGYLGPIPEDEVCPDCSSTDGWIYGKTTTDCAYSVDNIIKTTNGGMELVWGKERYFWDSTNLKWYETDPYTDVDQADYYAMYGKYYRKIKYSNGNLIDTCVVNGVDSGEVSDWVAWLDPTDSTFTKIIPLGENWEFDSLFTDDDGYLYYQRKDGVILFWSWTIEQWVEWARFEDSDVTPLSFYVDYVIPGNQKRVVVKYNNTNMDTITFQLYNFDAPSAHLEERILPDIEYNTIWEGYKVPNTYSQNVTLNLDEIMITAIDPVSIMKYLKIDRLYTKPNVVSYKDFFGRAIAYVMLHSSKLIVENTVSYGGEFTGDNGLEDLKFQVSNFWDEMGEPATVYEVIEELLRPFCLTFCYDDDTFQIYDKNKTSGVRTFRMYNCSVEGVLSYTGDSAEMTVVDDTWKDNNIQNPVIEIGSTYSKITGTASTSIPEYSTMAFDLVDYNNRNQYDANGLNIQRNKTKGYLPTGVGNVAVLDEDDYWYYIWNGVYTNPDFNLVSVTDEDYVNWYLNINKAYKYLTGGTGVPTDYGSVLNFYGGANNPTGTGREQSVEKSVEVKKRITAYAADNGTPLEFLETSDLEWNFTNNIDEYEQTEDAHLNIASASGEKFGSGYAMQASNRVVYHQEYANMTLSSTNQQTVDFSLTHSFSRTGIDTQIDILNNPLDSNNYFYLTFGDENYFDFYLKTATIHYFPPLWESSRVTVDYPYFAQYSTSGKCSPVWDKRRIDMYVILSDNTIYQFNGKEWVESSSVSEDNAFYIMKLLNYENLYHTDFKYNVIETPDYDSSNPNNGGHYSLTGERFTYYTDRYGGVRQSSVSGGTTYYCDPYNAEGNEWIEWINSCSEGALSIILPHINDISATIVVDVYNSTMLGSTGASSSVSAGSFSTPLYYKVEGTGYYYDYESEYRTATLTPGNIGPRYGTIMYKPVTLDYIPPNVSYVKAEHLDLSISMSVPESNLGQMFSQSDIKYISDNKKNYMEEFETAPFRINTFNNLVLSSFSYLIFGSDIADPGDFIIKGNSGRPEGYTVQAYMNWLGTIRKIYSKTIVPSVGSFSNTRRFITSSEVGEYPLMVISDNWDLKTNRHSIKAIECQNLDVDYVGTTDVIEIPRKARNDLFNLPTAVKK